MAQTTARRAAVLDRIADEILEREDAERQASEAAAEAERIRVTEEAAAQARVDAAAAVLRDALAGASGKFNAFADALRSAFAAHADFIAAGGGFPTKAGVEMTISHDIADALAAISRSAGFGVIRGLNARHPNSPKAANWTAIIKGAADE